VSARRLALGTVLRAINLAATAFASLLVMPFVVHSLGDRLYGLWALVGTFIGYYGLLDLGLTSAVNRYMAAALGSGDAVQSNRVFNTAVRLFVGIGVAVLAASAAAAGAAPWVTRNAADASLFGRVVLALGVNLALSFPVRVFIGTLNAHLRFEITAALDLLTLVVRTSLTVAVLLAGFKLLALALATLAASLPAMVLYVYFTHKNLPFLNLDRAYWSRPIARSLFAYSSFSFVAGVADILRFRVDGLVLAGFLNLAAVTHFSIASTMADYFIALVTAFTGVLGSVFSRQDGARDLGAIRRTLFFATKLSVILSTFIAFGLLAWGRAFIERWMGPGYVDAYPVLVVLTLGMMFALWQAPSVALLYGTSKHKFYALSNTVEGVANLVLSLLLVRRYGMIGVALGTVIPMSVIKLLIQPVYVCRVSGIAYWSYIGRTARTIGAALVSLAIPAWVSIRYAAPDYKSLVAVGVASAILYAVPLWFFGLTSEEADSLGRAVIPGLRRRRGVS